MTVYDVAVIGAGIAGVSIAAELADDCRVLLLEQEDLPGMHATGRSAAFWSETYGGPGVQPLTTASGDYLRDNGFLDPLGSLHIGRAEDAPAADEFLAAFADSGISLVRVDPAKLLPGIRADWVIGIEEPSCAYIDVAGLHAHYLSRARRAGAEVILSAPVTAAARDASGWTIETGAGRFRAGCIVNAAGAWADTVAQACGVGPMGLAAYRRTMVQLRTEPGPPPSMPHVAHLGGSFYFKPEGVGRLWLSPHDEIPSPPCDAAPEEIDIAIAIDRFEHVVDWRVAAVERRWAGLRTFARDRLPIYGFDPNHGDFFWFAGQGGFGIQTAPAAARLAASLLKGVSLPDDLRGIDAARYLPGRFATLA